MPSSRSVLVMEARGTPPAPGWPLLPAGSWRSPPRGGAQTRHAKAEGPQDLSPVPKTRAPRPQLWLSIDSCKMNKLLTSGQIQVLPNRRGTGPTMNQLTWPCPGAHNHTQTQLPNIFHESMCLAFWREGHLEVGPAMCSTSGETGEIRMR